MLRKFAYLFAGIIVLGMFFGDSGSDSQQTVNTPDQKYRQAPENLNAALTLELEKTTSLPLPASVSATGNSDLLTIDPQKAQILLSVAPEYRFVTGNRVNFRTGPSTQNPVLGQLSKGAKAIYLGSSNNWVHIGLSDGSNRSGWMSATFLSSNPAKISPAKPVVQAPQKPVPKRSIAAPTSREIAEARNILIRQSIANYSGSCPCPYNTDRGGRRCGKRSAWSRPGGYSPLCYDSDITEARLATHFARVRGVSN